MLFLSAVVATSTEQFFDFTPRSKGDVMDVSSFLRLDDQIIPFKCYPCPLNVNRRPWSQILGLLAFPHELNLTASKRFENRFIAKICKEDIFGDRLCLLQGQKSRS